MNCPICKAKGITAAHIMGHGGKGKPKTCTAADRKARATRMATINARRQNAPAMPTASTEHG